MGSTAMVGAALLAVSANEVHASATDYVLDVKGKCADTIEVRLRPNIRHAWSSVVVTSTYFGDFEAGWSPQPIEIQGLTVGATYQIVGDQALSGTIATSALNPELLEATTPTIAIDITFRNAVVLNDGTDGVSDERLATVFGTLELGSCVKPQPPAEQPPVQQPPVLEPPLDPPLASTTTVAPAVDTPSTTAPAAASTTTVVAPGAVTGPVSPAATPMTPVVPNPVVQQLPATGSDTPTVALAAALALLSGGVLVVAGRRR